MEPIVGNEEQEEIIMKLGALAHELFPSIGLYPFKGLFRISIRSAIEQSDFSNLEEVWNQEIKTKRAFFDRVLVEADLMLKKQDLSPDDIERLLKELKKFYDASLKTKRKTA